MSSTRSMGKLAVAQVGAPTAVVNATLWGFLQGAAPAEVLGVLGGPRGLVQGDLRQLRRPMSASSVPARDRASLAIGSKVAQQPGAWLGAGRHRFTDDELEIVIASLAAAGVEGIALIGGNGTMLLAGELHRRATGGSTSLAVIGLPKTVDNDLEGTDHCPGYPSAARFVVQAVRDLDLDHRAMTSIEQVRIVETLGRRTGWLALATLAARGATGGSPHLVYAPERPLDQAAFLDQVQNSVGQHGRALVVVAEGVSGPSIASPFGRDEYDRPISGGVAHLLAATVQAKLGYQARAEVLGLIQRCASGAVSPVDHHEAHALGVEGARLLRAGVSGVMAALSPRRPGQAATAAEITTISLDQVAGRTRAVPEAWVPEAAGDSPDLIAWLEPLLGTAPGQRWKAAPSGQGATQSPHGK